MTFLRASVSGLKLVSIGFSFNKNIYDETLLFGPIFMINILESKEISGNESHTEITIKNSKFFLTKNMKNNNFLEIFGSEQITLILENIAFVFKHEYVNSLLKVTSYDNSKNLSLILKNLHFSMYFNKTENYSRIFKIKNTNLSSIRYLFLINFPVDSFSIENSFFSFFSSTFESLFLFKQTLKNLIVKRSVFNDIRFSPITLTSLNKGSIFTMENLKEEFLIFFTESLFFDLKGGASLLLKTND